MNPELQRLLHVLLRVAYAGALYNYLSQRGRVV